MNEDFVCFSTTHLGLADAQFHEPLQARLLVIIYERPYRGRPLAITVAQF